MTEKVAFTEKRKAKKIDGIVDKVIKYGAILGLLISINTDWLSLRPDITAVDTKIETVKDQLMVLITQLQEAQELHVNDPRYHNNIEIRSDRKYATKGEQAILENKILLALEKLNSKVDLLNQKVDFNIKKGPN